MCDDKGREGGDFDDDALQILMPRREHTLMLIE